MDSSTSKPRLREQVRVVMRLHHYSIRTESYVGPNLCASRRTTQIYTYVLGQGFVGVQSPLG